MSTTPAWAEALNCNESTIAAWREQCPPDQSLLQWVLLTGKIDQDQYLQWAREHYQLVSIRADFFLKHQTFPQFKNWKSFHPWSAACCPIYQWNDILYVGCLEPEGLPDMLEIRPVLCPAEALQNFWNQLTPSAEQPTAPLNLNFENVSLSEDGSTPEEYAPQIEVQQPAQHTTSVPLSQPMTERLDFSDLGLTSEPAPEAPTHEVQDENTGQSESSFDLSDLSQAVSVVTETPSFEVETNPQPQAPKAPPQPITPTIELGKLKPRPTGTSKTNAWSEQVFAKLDEHFEAKMIVTRLDEGFVPRYWSAHWHPKNPQQCPFLNVEEPNIFRIAARSRRPFHGPISPNSVNDSFFDFWSNAEYPPQITVQPVVKDEKIIAMVVAVPKDSTQQSKKLRLIAEAGEKVSELIQAA